MTVWSALAELGHSNYRSYLASRHWAEFKAEYYRRYGRSCQANVCEREAEHLHHATYERLGAERFSDVLAVCASHHNLIHRKAGGVRDLEKLREATIWCCGNLSRSTTTLEKSQRERRKRWAKRANPCPVCGAERGKPCRHPDGRIRKKAVHPERQLQPQV